MLSHHATVDVLVEMSLVQTNFLNTYMVDTTQNMIFSVTTSKCLAQY